MGQANRHDPAPDKHFDDLVNGHYETEVLKLEPDTGDAVEIPFPTIARIEIKWGLTENFKNDFATTYDANGTPTTTGGRTYWYEATPTKLTVVTKDGQQHTFNKLTTSPAPLRIRLKVGGKDLDVLLPLADFVFAHDAETFNRVNLFEGFKSDPKG